MKAYILYIKELNGTEKEITVLDYVLTKEVALKKPDENQGILFEEKPPEP
jgi:hypothetical protein